MSGIRGYLVYVPFENVASMEYGGTSTASGSVTQPDKATIATTPGHLAGPFEVERTVQDAAEFAGARSGLIRVEVTSEADVTRMVAAFTVLPVLQDSDYEIWLSSGFGPGGGAAMRRAWREAGQRGATNPTDWGEAHGPTGH